MSLPYEVAKAELEKEITFFQKLKTLRFVLISALFFVLLGFAGEFIINHISHNNAAFLNTYRWQKLLFMSGLWIALHYLVTVRFYLHRIKNKQLKLEKLLGEETAL